MADNSIAKASRQLIQAYTTINTTAVSKNTLVADTATNIELNANTSIASIKTVIDDVIFVKYKTAVGDADVTTSNYDDIILSGELVIDRGVYKIESVKTTHISILSATAGDVFVIER